MLIDQSITLVVFFRLSTSNGVYSCEFEEEVKSFPRLKLNTHKTLSAGFPFREKSRVWGVWARHFQRLFVEQYAGSAIPYSASLPCSGFLGSYSVRCWSCFMRGRFGHSFISVDFDTTSMVNHRIARTSFRGAVGTGW